MKLKNKTAIITGASGALGNLVVEAFLSEGASVLAIAKSEEKLKMQKNKLKNSRGEYHYFVCDLTHSADVKKIMGQILERYKKIDVLINIAGGFSGGKLISDISLKEWEKVLDLNLTSTFLCCKYVMQNMIKNHTGKIVNISSMAAIHPSAKKAAYIVSKAGVIALTKSLAEEGKSFNIQCNAIAPSIILTENNQKEMPDADFSKWIKPENIAQTILFLVSYDAHGITGTIIEMP